MLRKILAGTSFAAVIAFAPAAMAQHRVGDTLMGAAAGALVGGPVGAVAGGAVGYTEGPHIAHHIFHHHYRHRYWSPRYHRWMWR